MNSLAQPRINRASIAHERSERLPDIVPYDQISDIILLGGLVVDDHQSGAAVFGQHRKACRRPDHQGRSDRQEQVAMPGQFRGAAHRVFGHRLPERDGGGLYRLGADGAVGPAPRLLEAPPYPGKVVTLPPTPAPGLPCNSVTPHSLTPPKS